MPGRKCRRAGTAAGGPALLGPGDAEFSHFLLQGRTLHPQAGRGPLRAGHHPAGLAEGAEDVLPLGVGQRHRRGSRLWSLRLGRLQVPEGHRDDGSVGTDQMLVEVCPFETVFTVYAAAGIA